MLLSTLVLLCATTSCLVPVVTTADGSVAADVLSGNDEKTLNFEFVLNVTRQRTMSSMTRRALNPDPQ
jgi:hypothetical protein